MGDKVKRFRVTLAVLLGGVGGSIAVTTPAQAAASDCPVGYFCIWTGYNFTGTNYVFSYATLVNGTNNGVNLSSSINNKGRSFYNRITNHPSVKVNIYDATHCDDVYWYRTMVNGQSANASGSDWTDRVSSIQLWNAAPLSC